MRIIISLSRNNSHSEKPDRIPGHYTLRIGLIWKCSRYGSVTFGSLLKPREQEHQLEFQPFPHYYALPALKCSNCHLKKFQLHLAGSALHVGNNHCCRLVYREADTGTPNYMAASGGLTTVQVIHLYCNGPIPVKCTN